MSLFYMQLFCVLHGPIVKVINPAQILSWKYEKLFISGCPGGSKNGLPNHLSVKVTPDIRMECPG